MFSKSIFFDFLLRLMSIYEFSVLRLVFFSTFLGLVYFTLSFFGFFFEFLEISDFLDLVLLRSVVFGRFLEISVHLRISCLEVSIFFNFLVFGIFLLSLLVFFLRITWNWWFFFFLELVLLRLVVFRISWSWCLCWLTWD